VKEEDDDEEKQKGTNDMGRVLVEIYDNGWHWEGEGGRRPADDGAARLHD
jgi:hypothetical protein